MKLFPMPLFANRRGIILASGIAKKIMMYIQEKLGSAISYFMYEWHKFVKSENLVQTNSH